MKKLIAILLLLNSACFGQQTFPAVGNSTSLWHTGGLLTSDTQMRMPTTRYLIPYFKGKGSYAFENDTFYIYNGSVWRPISGGGSGGVSQIYNYYGTNIHGGDSIAVDSSLFTTTYQNTLNEKLSNKVTTLASPNNTTYPTSALLNTIYGNSLTAIADSVLGRVKYIDSLTKYATPKNVKDSANSVRSAIPTNNNQLANGSNYAVLSTTLAGYGITNAWTKTEADSRYFERADSNTAQNPVTLSYFNTHSTPTPTITITGDVSGVGTNTITATLAATGTAGTPGSATQCPVITFDSKGRETGWTNTTITPAFASLTGKPTTIAGYGITDPIVLTSGSYSNPAWITALAFSKITFAGTSSQFVKGDGSLDNSAYIATISGISAGGDLTGTYANPTIKSSVALSGSPTATTPTAGDNSTKIATTAFTMGAIATATAVCVPYTGATGSVNIGSNSFYTTGSVGIGTTSPATPMEVVETATVTPRGITNSQYSNGNNSAQLHLRKSRGTPSVPLTVVTGDVIGRVMYEAYDGSNFLTMADIRATVTGSVTATRIPTYLSFYTATDATPSVMTERLRIGAAGDFNYLGSTSGTLTVTPPAAITSYTVTPPSAVGSAGQVQSISSVSGNSATFTWTTPVTSVAVTGSSVFAVTGSPITSTGTINIAFAATTVFTITPANSVTVDANNGNSQTITMNRATTTFTISNILEGRQNAITLEVLQDGTGSRGLAMSTTVKVPNNLGGLPPISTTANAIDVWTIQKIHGNIWVFVALNGN